MIKKRSKLRRKRYKNEKIGVGRRGRRKKRKKKKKKKKHKKTTKKPKKNETHQEPIYLFY